MKEFIRMIDSITKDALAKKLDEKAIVEYIKALSQISIICLMALNTPEEEEDAEI